METNQNQKTDQNQLDDLQELNEAELEFCDGGLASRSVAWEREVFLAGWDCWVSVVPSRKFNHCVQQISRILFFECLNSFSSMNLLRGGPRVKVARRVES